MEVEEPVAERSCTTTTNESKRYFHRHVCQEKGHSSFDREAILQVRDIPLALVHFTCQCTFPLDHNVSRGNICLAMVVDETVLRCTSALSHYCTALLSFA